MSVRGPNNGELTQHNGRGTKKANLVLTDKRDVTILFEKPFRQTSPSFKQIFL